MLARTQESRAVTELQIPHGSLPSSSGFAPISPACGEEVGREIEVKGTEEGLERRAELRLLTCGRIRLIIEPKQNQRSLCGSLLQDLVSGCFSAL